MRKFSSYLKHHIIVQTKPHAAMGLAKKGLDK